MLFLRVFGGLSLDGGAGKPPAVEKGNGLVILALIAAAGSGGITRQRLQSLFWPESDSERARRSLNQMLFGLRRSTDVPDMITGAQTLCIDSDKVSSDVGEFVSLIEGQRHREAVEKYSGAFLDGVSYRGGPDLDQWIDRERDRLQRAFILAVQSSARSAEEKSDFVESAALWKKVVDADPLNTPATISLMHAYARSGNASSALQVSKKHKQAMKEQLGLEVPPEFARLCDTIASEAGRNLETAMPQTLQPKPVILLDHSAASSRVKPVRTRRIAIAFSVSMVGLMALLPFTLWPRTPHRLDQPQSARLVVLPLINRTGERAMDAVGEMASDWITDGLARTQLVPVVYSRGSQSRIVVNSKPESAAARAIEVAKDLGASIVVEGSYYVRGDSVQFDVRIVDARNNEVLGTLDPVAASRQRPADAFVSLRSALSSLLAKLYDPRLAQVISPDAQLPSYDAYRDFVSTMDRWVRKGSYATDEERQDLRNDFLRAYRKDTIFVAPLIWAAFTYRGGGVPQSFLDTLSARRSRFAPIDRYAVDYFRSRVDGDIRTTIASAKSASDLSPSSEWSWNAGWMLVAQNQPREALRYLRRLDPNGGWMQSGWFQYWTYTTTAFHMLGQLDSAAKWIDSAHKQMPAERAILPFYAVSLALRGTPDSIRPIVDRELHSDWSFRVFRAYHILWELRVHGRNEEASQLLKQVAEWYNALGSDAIENDRYDFARILFAMDKFSDADRVFEKLQRDFPTSAWCEDFAGYRGEIAAIKGDTAAVRIADRVGNGCEKWIGNTSYWRARIAARLGRKEEAVSQLRLSFASGHNQQSTFEHGMRYDLPTLQGYAPFEQLVASR